MDNCNLRILLTNRTNHPPGCHHRGTASSCRNHAPVNPSWDLPLLPSMYALTLYRVSGTPKDQKKRWLAAIAELAVVRQALAPHFGGDARATQAVYAEVR